MTKQNQTKQARASYTREFSQESIHMALGVGCDAVAIMETSRRLSIPLSTLSRWIDRYRNSGEINEQIAKALHALKARHNSEPELPECAAYQKIDGDVAWHTALLTVKGLLVCCVCNTKVADIPDSVE